MLTIFNNVIRRITTGVVRLPRRLHRGEGGTISIVSVFAVLLLTMLLGMVMNVGRQADGKIRLQNAADASAYSGGLVIARGMNALAFTNHLLFDVFALTAFMREARDRNSEPYVPSILAAWQTQGPLLGSSGFPKFQRLGAAVVQKVPLEQELVRSYSAWAAAASENILPMLEEILAEELIPQFQRAVVLATPDVAQTAAMEIALRHGRPQRGRGRLQGVLWRTSAMPVGGDSDSFDRTLPVVDPVMDTLLDRAQYMAKARGQRRQLAHKYLGDWNYEAMYVFDHEGKMSQFSALWRSFTCGYLNRLLEEEYPNSNLPHMIRVEQDEVVAPIAHLEEDFTFLGVAYWQRLPEILPGLFRSPLEGDAVAYAQVRVFVPHRRLVWHWLHPYGGRTPIGGVPGEFPDLPDEELPEPEGEGRWIVGRQHVPDHWDLLNEHWTVQLVPSTTQNLAVILQTEPAVPDFDSTHIRLPNLGDLTTEDIGRISPH